MFIHYISVTVNYSLGERHSFLQLYLFLLQIPSPRLSGENFKSSSSTTCEKFVANFVSSDFPSRLNAQTDIFRPLLSRNSTTRTDRAVASEAKSQDKYVPASQNQNPAKRNSSSEKKKNKLPLRSRVLPPPKRQTKRGPPLTIS